MRYVYVCVTLHHLLYLFEYVVEVGMAGITSVVELYNLRRLAQLGCSKSGGWVGQTSPPRERQ